MSLEDSYICHIVIPLKDYLKSKAFFEGVFGWRVEAQESAHSFDVLPPSGRGISAELNPDEEAVVPSIHTANIEAVLKRIESFGGKILKKKTQIGNEAELGYYALFEDPNGNRMCLYSEK